MCLMVGVLIGAAHVCVLKGIQDLAFATTVDTVTQIIGHNAADSGEFNVPGYNGDT